MLSFNEFQKLSESTRDLLGAIGQEKTDKLLKTKKDPHVQSMHDDVFGAGNHHIEIPLHHESPKIVKDHVEAHGGKIIGHDGSNVKLPNGRDVPTSKFLARSKASKEVQDAHQNHQKHASGESKLVISRHPGEVASASCNTAWDSCANPTKSGEEAPAAEKLPGDIKHGTMIALHVHKDAKPNEHGEYDSKDVHGRVLIKRHDSENGHTSFHPEGRSYGKFPENAKKASSRFTDKHYPMQDIAYKKHDDLYDDDHTPEKANPKADASDIDKAQNSSNDTKRIQAAGHPNANSEHLHKALNDKSVAVRIKAASHPNANSEHLHKALGDEDSSVRKGAASHKNASSEHLDRALKDSHFGVRASAAQNSNATSDHLHRALRDRDLSARKSAALNPNATPSHLEVASKDPHPVVRAIAAKHPNATPEHLKRSLDDPDPMVRNTAADAIRKRAQPK